MKRIKILEWCSHNDASGCLDLVLNSQPDKTAALRACDAGQEWTTPKSYLAPVADAFVACIVKCGGKAELVD